MGRRRRGERIKYRYKGKEELHAKLVFGEMTLDDVISVVRCPGYVQSYHVHVALDDDPKGDKYSFRTEGDELQAFKKKYHWSWVEDGPTILWFRLSEKARVSGDTVEVRPLKGTKKKTARLKFMIDGRRLGEQVPVDIIERTAPEDTYPEKPRDRGNNTTDGNPTSKE